MLSGPLLSVFVLGYFLSFTNKAVSHSHYPVFAESPVEGVGRHFFSSAKKSSRKFVPRNLKIWQRCINWSYFLVIDQLNVIKINKKFENKYF